MTDIAPPLVCNRVYDVNTAARALTTGKLDGSLESAVLAALTAKLKIRGTIVEAGAIGDSGSWIDSLCLKYPTKRTLLQSKWEALEKLMQLDEHVNEADKEAVWTVWSEGHALRKKVKEFGLPPSIADRIVEDSFQSMEFMKESELIEQTMTLCARKCWLLSIATLIDLLMRPCTSKTALMVLPVV
ncbi:hypothetical protein P3T76_001525 [Phytophthora citrophthora]|uniref:Uncharacterized protein n=1 Tax=Phytophthora citrophthora TaxID=4793 RepID=A0AAD9GYR2_9STRA|nr:hypothetical protein P3T76_001525 [Phytophthora citrophthora]